MARIFITGSADGLGRFAAQTLVEGGHELVIHDRSTDRLTAVDEIVGRGAAVVVGDLADIEETRGIARDVDSIGRMDAVIHNAGVYTGPQVLAVNIVAPYLLTALQAWARTVQTPLREFLRTETGGAAALVTAAQATAAPSASPRSTERENRNRAGLLRLDQLQ